MKNTLPTWKLSDLYKTPKDKEITKTIEKSLRSAKRFEKKYRGKLSTLSGSAKSFSKSLQEYSDIYTEAVKPVIYASLRFSETSADASRGAFLQSMRSQYTATAQHLLFFDLELIAIPKAKIQKILKNQAVAPYKNFLEQVLSGKNHRLTELEERLLSDKSLTGKGAFSRLFDEEMGSSRYEVKLGKKAKNLSQTEALNLLHSSDRASRKSAALAVSTGLEKESRRTSYIYNTLIEDKAVNDRYRKYKNAEESRHRDNQIDQQMVDALTGAVTESYKVVQDFYRFKKKVLKLDTLYDYDRYAPIAKSSKKVPYLKAKDMIVSSFEDFSPDFSRRAKDFFDKNWIDARERPGKRGGAFCQMGTPEMHPYVFINYSGSMRDVFTLAHELGHGIHGYLMEDQNYLNYDVPLTVCETASVFSEMLLFEHLKKNERSEKELFSLYMHKIESVFATVYRQVSMFLFERDVHEARKSGELMPQDFCKIWMKRQKEMFGNSITFTEGYQWWWSYIPHFIHTPFYVYAYAYGELLTLSLYNIYQEEGAKFPEKFLNMLSLGGSQNPATLVKPFKINMKSKAFWQGGVSVIKQLVQEAKAIKP